MAESLAGRSVVVVANALPSNLQCIGEVKYTFTGAGVVGLPSVDSYPTARWASVQVQLGAVRFCEDGGDPTASTGELVTCSDTTNPPRIWFDSYVTTGLPLVNVKLLSPGSNAILIVKYWKE